MLAPQIVCSPSSCTSSPPLPVMEASALPSPTTEKSDVFSISDQALSDRLQFIQEVSHFTASCAWLVRLTWLMCSADWVWKLGQRLAMSPQALVVVSRWPGDSERTEDRSQTCPPVQNLNYCCPRSISVRPLLWLPNPLAHLSP